MMIQDEENELVLDYQAMPTIRVGSLAFKFGEEASISTQLRG